MLARVQSAAVVGIDPFPLAVEVDNHPGLNLVNIVGLPDAAVKESRDRVGSALRNSGFRFPRGVVIINLAPADVRKEGSALDLPIALGLLVASEQLSGMRLAEYAAAGELALDGSIRPVAGALSLAIGARQQRLRGILLPVENAPEAGVVEGVEVIPVRNLNEAASFMLGAMDIPPYVTDVRAIYETGRRKVPDLTDVKGQAHVKRAMTVAAAGGHNLLKLCHESQTRSRGFRLENRESSKDLRAIAVVRARKGYPIMTIYRHVLSRRETVFWSHRNPDIQGWKRVEIAGRVASTAAFLGAESWEVFSATEDLLGLGQTFSATSEEDQNGRSSGL